MTRDETYDTNEATNAAWLERRTRTIKELHAVLLDNDLGPSIDPAWEHNALFFIAEYVEKKEDEARNG